ncbi:MAG: hypothetical protein KGI54_17175 [Pseudomonadota bacterium]|nr:hypothetical protein [Pseudomonadota bacterium]
MDWASVNSVLYTLPAGYLRSGDTFTWWQNSLTNGLTGYTYVTDGLNEQYDFATAQNTWLDVWTQLTGNVRFSNESDTQVRQRITILLQQGRSAAPAIENYVFNGLGYQNFVVENFSYPYWQLNLVQSNTNSIYKQIIGSISQVRPAGVPFEITVPFGGLYLDSINYLDAPSVTGAFLTTPTSIVPFGPSGITNQSQPTLPTTYLSDPVLNS